MDTKHHIPLWSVQQIRPKSLDPSKIRQTLRGIHPYMVYTPTWFLSVSHFTSLSLRFGVSDLSVSHFTSLSLRFGVSDFVCLSLAWSVRFRASLNQASLRFGVSDVGWVFHSVSDVGWVFHSGWRVSLSDLVCRMSDGFFTQAGESLSPIWCVGCRMGFSLRPLSAGDARADRGDALCIPVWSMQSTDPLFRTFSHASRGFDDRDCSCVSCVDCVYFY